MNQSMRRLEFGRIAPSYVSLTSKVSIGSVSLRFYRISGHRTCRLSRHPHPFRLIGVGHAFRRRGGVEVGPFRVGLLCPLAPGQEADRKGNENESTPQFHTPQKFLSSSLASYLAQKSAVLENSAVQPVELKQPPRNFSLPYRPTCPSA